MGPDLSVLRDIVAGFSHVRDRLWIDHVAALIEHGL
jgi:hypothetical protein